MSLTDVSLRRDGRVVLDHVNWCIYPGEQWAIVGKNSTGKSTLARAVAGRLPLAGGTLRYHVPTGDGTSAEAVEGTASGVVAYVAFEGNARRDGAFYQSRWHAGLESTAPIVASQLSATSIWRRNRYEVVTPRQATAAFRTRRRRVIADLELRPLLRRRFDQLSDGEWRRVQIARALLRAPLLLILDSPFSGLDTHFRERLRELLSRLTDYNTQICMIAANPLDIPESITHVMILGQGHVVAQGEKEMVLADPETQAAQTSTSSNAGTAASPPARPTATPIIQMRNIHVVHKGTPILRGIDWTVREGERWALMGPNGAGKTTLLSLILGDHPQAYANEISIFGRRRGSGESIWEIKERIGWIAPELHRHYPPTTTCFDVVCSGFFDALGLYGHPTPEQQLIAERWLQKLGLEQEHATPMHRLAKSQQRLALIARALVKAPALLILDEPCQGLDVEHERAVVNMVDRVIEATDATMIYVTHRRSRLPNSLTHILELRGGTIRRQEPLIRTH